MNSARTEILFVLLCTAQDESMHAIIATPHEHVYVFGFAVLTAVTVMTSVWLLRYNVV
jgi:hypothetical protein